MLLNLAVVILVCISIRGIFLKCKLPPLVGYLIVGIILGKSCFNWLDGGLMDISGEIRKVALAVILLRSGLALNLHDLKKIGRGALLMCFVPAVCELITITAIAPSILGLTYLEGAILGSVLAAVSPAVIVPRMLAMIDKKQGTEKGLPQMIMAGASFDDVLVIVIFSTLVSVAKTGNIDTLSLVLAPVGMIVGVGIGVLVGWLVTRMIKRFSSIAKAIIVLAIALLFVGLEDLLDSYNLPFSSLLATMSMGMAVFATHRESAKEVSNKLTSVWYVVEMLLFVVVGASVDFGQGGKLIGLGIAVVVIGILARCLAVQLCLIKTPYNAKERLFCSIAYCPKATVQAGIGGVPLAMGLACGSTVLVVAAVAILLTATVGAITIDITRDKLVKI